MIEFSKPSGGSFLDAKDAVDHLIYIADVVEVYDRPDKFNSGQMQKCVKANVVDLDGDAALREVTLTARWLVADLNAATTNFLGRIERKDTGKVNAAYVWGVPSGEDEKRAIAWIEANQSKPTFAQPAAKAAKPAPAKAAEPTGDEALDNLLAEFA